MRRINNVGKEMLEYHNELSKDHSDLIRNSLINTLQQMLNNDVIDLKTFEYIQDKGIDEKGFLKILMENKRYRKTREEILKESEKVRKELNEDLKENNLAHLSSESKIETYEIYICKTFTIDREFVIDYFGVERKDIAKLMNRKGFVEKFVALRLVKVLKDIIKKGRYEVSKITLTNSLAYIDESGEKYNIDLVMKARVSDLEDVKSKREVIADIKKIESISEREYKNKMKS